MPEPTRRSFLRASATGLALGGALATRPARADGPQTPRRITLSFGTYGMKGMKLEDALRALDEIGFDGVEIAAHPGYDGEPATMPADRRRAIRRQLDASGLAATALMENLPPAEDDRKHRDDLDRLRRVLELARDLASGQPPLVETILGGGTWDEKKALFRDRLADWQAAASEAGVVVAIKPHRGGSMTRPDEAIWLIGQLGNSPWLRMVYDYSHYAFRDMPVEDTVRTALPYTAHVVVKDAVQKDGKVVFTLPDEGGTFDYADLLRRLAAGGYGGDVCCEVSSMVSNRPGYRPIEAATASYGRMARAFRDANLSRSDPAG